MSQPVAEQVEARVAPRPRAWLLGFLYAALFLVGGFVSHQLGEPEDQVAYESVVQPSTPDAISARAQLITASDQSDQRDAALQYILSY